MENLMKHVKLFENLTLATKDKDSGIDALERALWLDPKVIWWRGIGLADTQDVRTMELDHFDYCPEHSVCHLTKLVDPLPTSKSADIDDDKVRVDTVLKIFRVYKILFEAASSRLNLGQIDSLCISLEYWKMYA